MKQSVKYAILLALVSLKALAIPCLDSCDCESTSKSHLAVRPLFESHSPIQRAAFRAERLHACHEGHRAAGQFVVYGSKTTNPEKLARYFGPFCKSFITVASQATAFNATTQLVETDVMAENFNIFTKTGQFHSVICFKPQQSVLGFAFHGRKSFWRDEERGRGCWISATLPVERVTNTMGLHETIIVDGNGANTSTSLTGPNPISAFNVVGNMTEAFVQSDWKFSKVPCGSISRTGIADMELKLGYEWLDHEPCHLESYIGFLAPTGKKGENCYMWAPVVGHGQHFGVMFGGEFSAVIWESESGENNIRMDVANHTLYLFENTQCRSFDLNCKPWSRFIQLYADEEQATESANLLTANLRLNNATPGINLLTLNASVTPGFSHNTLTSFIFTSNKFQAELGYNLYSRQSECVNLASSFPIDPAIKSIAGNGITNPTRDITGDRRLNLTTLDIPLSQYDDSRITEDDINLASAAAPAGISNTLYGSFGWRWDDYERPFFINFGGLYEWGKSTNGIANRWAAWAKAGWSI
jgi:hypothetical protein